MPSDMTGAQRDEHRYRANVGLAVFNPAGRVFLGRRIGASGPYAWQMPQGGVDPGETPLDAALRELEEEIGVSPASVAVLEETPEWLYYDFPPEIGARLSPSGRVLGQRQKWFALRFLGEDGEIRLDRHTPEFGAWRWVELTSAPSLVIPFKRPVYEEVARRFRRFAVGELPGAP